MCTAKHSYLTYLKTNPDYLSSMLLRFHVITSLMYCTKRDCALRWYNGDPRKPSLLCWYWHQIVIVSSMVNGDTSGCWFCSVLCVLFGGFALLVGWCILCHLTTNVLFQNRWKKEYKTAVISQRWPRNAPKKVNKHKQPYLHLRSRDSWLTQFNRTLRT